MADFSQITERLFCGAAINSADDVSAIIAAGVTHIIDAQVERNDSPLIGTLGYLWDPTADDGVHPKPITWFANAITFALGALIVPGTKVLAHCAGGINRGPSLTYAILRAQGWSKDDAFALLKAKRPQVNVAYRDDADAALHALGWTHVA